MRAIWTVLFALGIFAGSAQAQNLLTNGNFQTGDFTGWTASGNLRLSQGNLLLSSTAGPTGTLSQSFEATVGQAYQLSFAYGGTGVNYEYDEMMRATVADLNGNMPVHSVYYSSWRSSEAATSTYNAIFVATSPVMTLSFKDESLPATTQDGLLNNISVMALPGFAHAGNYAGTDVETISFADGTAVDTRTLTVKMQIDSAGRMQAVLGPVYDYTVGTINNGGEVTLGNLGLYTGTATFKGNDIVFHVTEYHGVGGNFNYTATKLTRAYSLHRVTP